MVHCVGRTYGNQPLNTTRKLGHSADTSLTSKPVGSVVRRSLISVKSASSGSTMSADNIGTPQLMSLPSVTREFRTHVAMTEASIPESLKKECMLFYTPETAPLARRIAAVNPSKITLGNIRWKKFPDGFPDIFVEDAVKIRNKHVAFLASFHNPSVIFEQISVVYALPRLFVGSFTVVLPFFPTGTLERVENEGEIATAFTLARILSNVPPSRGGPTSLVTFDIHALQERFYFGDAVLPLFESGIPLLLERLRRLPDYQDVTIAYPDEGAWKRFHLQFRDEGYPEVICTKVRDGAKRIVRLKEGQPDGRHVVIVDDLVQSGSTIIECQKLLASAGAKHVSAYVTHGVFPVNSWQKFVQETEGEGAKSGMKYFWLTDSCPQTMQVVEGRAPFEILSLADPIAAALEI